MSTNAQAAAREYARNHANESGGRSPSLATAMQRTLPARGRQRPRRRAHRPRRPPTLALRAAAMIEALDRQLEQGLRRLARRQPGCRALMRIGELTAPTILCELGDVTRLSASRKAVRCAGPRPQRQSREPRAVQRAGRSSGLLAGCASAAKRRVSWASTTAWTRSRRLSFWRMCVMCVLTVASLM
jgi:hypothetical protein